MHGCVRLQEVSKGFELPSWVMGGDFQRKRARVTLDSHFNFNASNSTPPSLVLDLENNADLTIRLNGFKVATIEKITYLSLDHASFRNIDTSVVDLLKVFGYLFDPWGIYQNWRAWDNGDEPLTITSRPPGFIDGTWDENAMPGVFSWRRSEALDHLRAHWNHIQ